MQKILLLSLLLSSFAYSADYTKCAQYLNPSMNYLEDSPSINPGIGGGFGTFGPLGYLPFEIDNTGKVTPHNDVVSYSQEENGNESITFEMPSFVPDNNPNKTGNPFKQKMRQVKVNIQRAENGDIQNIIYDESLTQAEIDAMQASARTFYEQNTPEEIRKQNEQWAKSAGLESYQLPFYAQSKKTLSFEIKNGQCVPMELKNEALIEAKADGNTFETTQSNTALCKEIDEFLEQNPEAAACLKSDLNTKMADIFKKYIPNQSSGGWGYPGIGGMGVGYGGMGFGGYGGYGMPMYGMSLENYLMGSQSLEYIPEDQRDAYLARIGSSPVITGNMLYQNCIDGGLGPIIEDESIWVEAPIASPDSEGESGDSQAVEN
tara:strand:+ start:54905 stop:56032 length:1128 start_codon:yes stop_codon:yes gene_type:complete